MDDAVRIVLVTCPAREVAVSIARTLVFERLAACVNIVSGVESIYEWKEEIEQTEEVLLIVKTSVVRLSQLESRLDELHPYETPEFVALAPECVSASYRSWLLGNLA